MRLSLRGTRRSVLRFPFADLAFGGRRYLLAVAFICSCILGCSSAVEETVTISANDQMKFDVAQIAGKVGQKLTITLINNGSLMPHNLVILKPGTDLTAFVAAATKRAGEGYLPKDEQAAHIIVHTKLLDGGDSDKISFTPTSPGVYEYVCTYPGHAAAGMHGKITVQ